MIKKLHIISFIRKNIFVSCIVLLLVIGLILSVIVSQRATENRSRAAASTTLSLLPSSSPITPLQPKVGDPLSLTLNVNPGTNQVSFIQFELDYDPTVLSLDTTTGVNGIQTIPYTQNNQTNTMNIIGTPNISTPGIIQVSMSIGSSPTNVIVQQVNVANINFHVIGASSSSQVTFNTAYTQAYSLASADQPSENVLSTTNPAYIVTASAIVSPTPTVVVPTNTIVPTLTPTPTQIVDTIPPTVIITNPLANSTLQRGKSMTITASASDNIKVANVQFSINGKVLCNDLTTPYTCVWSVPSKPKTQYTISATASDAAGNAATSIVHATSSK